MTTKIPKVVNIIEREISAENEGGSGAGDDDCGASVDMATKLATAARTLSTRSQKFAADREEILFTPPTFKDRFMRYFVVVIYLCGLCCLGFFLSIYYIVFWDSRMPPVYKPKIAKSISVKL